MHIGKILKDCEFRVLDDTGNFSVSRNSLLECLKDTHPLQVINSSIAIPVFCVRYQYTTVRGNIRIGKKYYFGYLGGASTYEQEIMAESSLLIWVDVFNTNHPYRKISNVKVLEVIQIANAFLKLF